MWYEGSAMNITMLNVPNRLKWYRHYVISCFFYDNFCEYELTGRTGRALFDCGVGSLKLL